MPALITNLDDSFGASIREQVEFVRTKIRASVRAIVVSDGGEKPIIIGSGTLLYVDGGNYIATAAHVIDSLDEFSRGALHIVGSVGTEPVQMIGKILVSAKPVAGRAADKIDIAFWRIEASQSVRLGDVQFFDVTGVYQNRSSNKDKLFMAVGFPVSKNKKRVDYQRRQISTSIWTYTTGLIEKPELAREMGISGQNHLFMPYDKYSQNEGGLKVSSIEPRGLSGGPVVYLGNFSNPGILDPKNRQAGGIAGIVIEKSVKHRALVAVKIGIVLDAIRRYSEAS